MKLLFLLFTMATVPAFSSVKSVQAKYVKKGPFSDSWVYKIKYCKDAQCQQTTRPIVRTKLSTKVSMMVAKEVGKTIRIAYYKNGYRISQKRVHRSNFRDAYKTLKKDYTNSDGDDSRSRAELKKLRKFYFKNRAHLKISVMTMQVHKYNGDAWYYIYMFYNVKTNEVTTTRKLIWST